MLRTRITLGILAAAFVGTASTVATAETENRWEKTIQGFEKRDAATPPPKDAVLFIGSSTIRFWPLDDYFPEVDTINRGFGGSQTSDALEFVDRIAIPYAPRTIVFYSGDNDIAAGKSPEEVRDDFQSFASAIHEALPNTRVLLLSIKPSLARWELRKEMRAANSLLKTLCAEHEHLTYIDMDAPMLGEDATPRKELFVKDGLHLSPNGYRLWSDILRAHLTP